MLSATTLWSYNSHRGLPDLTPDLPLDILPHVGRDMGSLLGMMLVDSKLREFGILSTSSSVKVQLSEPSPCYVP
jgi:hypothetical protein